MVQIKDLGKKSRPVIYGEEKPGGFDPLTDMIGIIKTKKKINVEDILQERGFCF
ncbi:MAG: hypothetical protein PVF58_02440 [Candidatus Methanofastidiosia archaeon]|jgi:hypothetical protein